MMRGQTDEGLLKKCGVQREKEDGEERARKVILGMHDVVTLISAAVR